jgi:hypothetical protein
MAHEEDTNLTDPRLPLQPTPESGISIAVAMEFHRGRATGFGALIIMKMATIIAAVFAIIGCAKTDSSGFAVSDLRSAIATQEVIELKNFTAFSWDRVHFFPPYTTQDIIKKQVGKKIPFPNSSSEGYCLVVFMAGITAAESFEVARSDADFSKLFRPGGYGQEETRFTVERSADGWKKLIMTNNALRPTSPWEK